MDAEYNKTEIFGLHIPSEVDGVPSEILDPENTVGGATTLIVFHYFSIFKVFWVIGNFCLISVVRQTSIQGDTAEAG